MVERLLALLVVAASGGYLLSALGLPAGSTARPGPGFFPLAIGAFGALVALVWTATAFRRAPAARAAERASDRTPAEATGRVAATAAALIAFCLLLPWIGYPVAALLFVALVLRCLGAGWRMAVLTGVVSAVVSFYVFGVLLGVPLPRGLLLD
jgi:hypothetical protein